MHYVMDKWCCCFWLWKVKALLAPCELRWIDTVWTSLDFKSKLITHNFQGRALFIYFVSWHIDCWIKQLLIARSIIELVFLQSFCLTALQFDHIQIAFLQVQSWNCILCRCAIASFLPSSCYCHYCNMKDVLMKQGLQLLIVMRFFV